MRIKIKSCALPTYWYFNCIGLTFEVCKTTSETEHGSLEIYKLTNQEDGKYINIKDCEVIEDEVKYVAIYVGLDNTSDLGVFEAKNGNFDSLVDIIMDDVIANEEHSTEELKIMKEILNNRCELVSNKRFYRIIERKEK